MPDEEGDDYFNDLNQQPAAASRNGNNENTPKAKRIACSVCRKRKLRCDGERPSCGTCKRLSHECSYDDVRRKSGPKRGYVKALEARLAQVETLLHNKDGADGSKNDTDINIMDLGDTHGQQVGNLPPLPENGNLIYDTEAQGLGTMGGNLGDGIPAVAGAPTMPTEEPFQWELIGLGLEEPLPSQDVINELHEAYFEKAHPSIPIVHRPRYLAAMNLAPHMRPPIALRYIIWASAAVVLDKYSALHEPFYLRARKYAQIDEMRGHGEGTISVAHAQAWILISGYEFRCMYFPRAWLSVGRASRLVQMMGLHRLDGTGLDVKQTVAPPRDWTEREERRRTFWMAYCEDRYASVGTGWPMTIDERDILTNLPATEDAFDKSKPMRSVTLSQALEPNGAQHLTPFGGIVLMACLFGRNLTHLHRPEPNDNEDDMNGAFWKRHRNLENVLLSTALALPDSLRLPRGINDPNVIFMNMNIHTSTICLHQAAIFKAERNKLTTSVASESKVRCISAATEIASIMRLICHMDLSAMNPFIAFCVYVAARVLLQYLRTRTQDSQVRSSLQFLVSALHALTKKNPLTESFLCQLDVDLEGAGITMASLTTQQKTSVNRWAGVVQSEMVTSDVVCTPLLEINDNDARASNHVQHAMSSARSRGAHSGATALPANYEMDPGAAFATSPGSSASLPTRGKPTPGPYGILALDRGTSLDASGDMIPSPGGSGSHDEPTPSSSNNPQSSRTSNSYTPDQRDNLQYPTAPSSGYKSHGHMPGLFPSGGSQPSSSNFQNPNTVSTLASDAASYLSPDFNSFTAGNQDFNMPLVDWDMGQDGHTGFTPASSGPWDQLGDGMGTWTASPPNVMEQQYTQHNNRT